MKILHTVQLYYPHLGGSEEVVKQLSERLVKRGHDVTVATAFDPNRSFTELNGVKIKSFRISGNAAGGITGETQSYIDFIRQSRCDVMMNYAAQIWCSDLVFPILDTLRCKKVFVPCGYSTLHHPLFSRYFAELPQHLRKYDKLVHLSANYRDIQFSKAHHLQNYVVIPNAAAEEEFLSPAIGFREKYGIKTRHMLLCVANHYHQKGHAKVIQWFKALNRPDATLVIIGQNVAGECYAQCVVSGQGAGNIFLLTDVAREWVVSAYKEADLFLFGSEIECFPLVILEAMAARTPFVSTDAGNVAELPGGLVCAPENVVGHVRRLLDNPAERQTLGEIGQREWAAKYTWEKVVDQYEALYGSLMDQENRSKKFFTSNGRRPAKVSVVIPCYNHAQYLPEAVESVINQSCRDFEIIIMNDGSTDNTQETAERLIKKYPTHSIRLVNQNNQGLSQTRNNAIKNEAQGQYILPLDADDMIKTTFLEETVRVLDSRPEVDIVYTFQQRFGAEDGVFAQEKFAIKDLCENNRLNYCSLFRKKAWEVAGGYNPNMKWGYEDWDLWIACAEKGCQFEVIRQPLFLYRIRPQSMFSESLKHDAELRAQIARNHPNLYSESTRRWADLYFQYLAAPDHADSNAQLVEHFLTKGDWPQAVPHIIQCLKSYPDNVDLHLMLGVGLLKCGDTKSAEATLQKAVDAQPNHLNALFNLGICKLLLDKDEEAEKHFEDVIELKPDWPDTYALLAALRILKNREKDANSLLVDALNFQPCVQPIRQFMQDLASDAPKAAKFYLEAILNPNLSFNSVAMLEAKPHLSAVKNPAEWDEEKPREMSLPKVSEVNAGPTHGSSSSQTSNDGFASKPEAQVVAVADIHFPGVPRPKMVSVIIPTHNRPALLVEAVQSVLNQTYKDFEIIVINDGDTEVESVLQLLNREGNIVYVRHSENRGLAAARNSGLQLARGKYIAYLDDDDVYYPDHLETLIGFMENTGAKVAYSDAYRAYQVLDKGTFVTVQKEIPYSQDFNADAMLLGNYIPVLCIAHAKDCLEKSGVFDERLKANEDFDLWIRLSRHYPFYHLKKTTCEFRVRHDGSNMTVSRLAYCRRIELYLYQKYHEYAKDRPDLLQEQQRRAAIIRAELARLEAPPADKMEQNPARAESDRVTMV